jgi:hypothetical protein
MRFAIHLLLGALLLVPGGLAQQNAPMNPASPKTGPQKRLWVLRAMGEMAEYDPATFAAKGKVKVPAEAVKSPRNLAVNHLGQILFAPTVSLPLADSDVELPRKAWLWNGHDGVSIDLGVKRDTTVTGSNHAITETAPSVFLSAEGSHLFWFANQSRRLVREDVDLTVTPNWQAWQTDLTGGQREDLASVNLPECRCPTGACEDSCPYGAIWAPVGGVGTFFGVTELVSGKDGMSYKGSTLYKDDAGKWAKSSLADPLRRMLDATPDGNVIVEAIPDTGCCGWSNQSDDQTLVLAEGKIRTVFDEQATYENQDYDVSFFTSNAKLSPQLDSIAMTIKATATMNQPIQLAEQGQANPEESQSIRKSLANLPAVEIKSMDDPPKRNAFLAHAELVGWISEKEVLIIEAHALVAYNVATKARRKSNIRIEDAASVFLR